MSFLEKYSRFITNKPYIALGLIIIITIFAVIMSGRVGTESTDNRDILPDDNPVIAAFNLIEDNFGSSDSIMISVEVSPEHTSSNEIRDIRDPDAIRYLYLLTKLAERTDDVMSATSAGTLIKSLNNDALPKNKREVIDIIEANPSLEAYLSSDHEMGIVKIYLSDEYTEQGIVNDLKKVITQVDKPAGLEVNVAGDVAEGPVMEQEIGPDMGRTSRFSMIGIFIVLLLLFSSLRYALTPLSVIAIGIIWAFGFMGVVGKSISSVTSGAVSMIMGVGIDFGIQTITRFRLELKEQTPEKAMEITLKNVFWPMATTTIAALIGFKAMSMGDLTIMEQLGSVMSYGILFCFFAAITVVPVVSVIGENVMMRLNSKKEQKKNKKKLDSKKNFLGGKKK